MSKYSIAKTAIADATAAARAEGLDPGDAIEALIIMAVQDSIVVRGAALTRQSLVYELSNIAGEVDVDFIRSR